MPSIALGAAEDDCSRWGSSGSWFGATLGVFTESTRAEWWKFGDYCFGHIYLRFNTSVIPPGATLTSAKLWFYTTNITDMQGYSLYGEYFLPASWPPVATDFALESAADALTVANPIAEGVWHSPSLTNLGSISRDDYTGLRMTLGTGTPADVTMDLVDFDWYENGSGKAPYLEVEYAGVAKLAMFVR